MKLTNTLTRKKEDFKPLKIEKVKVYFCGPTPYNFPHIGNLRAYLFSDMVVRTLKFLGFRIETSMNITDIDDKTIRDSQKTGVNLKDFTEKFTNIFFEDLEKIRVRKADNIMPISNIVDEMVLIINGLLDKGYAYLAEDGSIYFSISKFKTYGELAHLDVKGMKSSVRIDNDEYEKEDVGDFALWKAYNEIKDGPNKWEGKFLINGKEAIIQGRPGWHIECSACNMKFFGPQIDLHMGAIDNIFPHHQNEIAQTEAYTGKKFSKYWMHSGHLLVDNKKMSKSLNNFYTLKDIEEKLSPEFSSDYILRGFRFMNYMAKYSDSFNFTYDKLKQSIQNIKSFDELFKRIKNYDAELGVVKKEVSENLQYFIQGYIVSLEDDFNTVEALTYIFEYIRYVNTGIDDGSFNKSEISAILSLFKTFDEVLNIFDFEILNSTFEVPIEIEALIKERIDAKNNKDFKKADEIRALIEEKGYRIIDDKNGSRAELIKK